MKKYRSFLSVKLINYIGVFAYAIILIALDKAGKFNFPSVFTVSMINGVFFAINTNVNIVNPLKKLWQAIKGIDFEKNEIDFTKIDTLDLQGTEEVREIIMKFKYLVSAFSDRVLMLNSVSYKGEHDQLTGCYNRLHLDKVKSSYEVSENFYILFCDVNNLKRMNDEFGHEAGDALLRHAADKLSFWSTYGDVYRLGGDEFMVVVTDASRESFDSTVSRWYKTVGQLNREADKFKCMIAIGVAYGERNDSFDLLEKQADEKMYIHKLAIKKANGEPLTREDAILLENSQKNP